MLKAFKKKHKRFVLQFIVEHVPCFPEENSNGEITNWDHLYEFKEI